MPNNQTSINIGVKYNVDQTSVNAVKKSLQDLQNIKLKDFSGTKTQLDLIKLIAGKVESALTKAFNVNLNSLNTQQFNTSLKEVGLSIDKIYTSFSKAGAQGQVAFSRMASEVLTTNMQLKLTNSLVSQMGETMANTVKWGIASSIMNNFTNSVQQAFQYVKSLDSALTDIRIVTGDSTEQMKEFAAQANNAAQSLGRSTMDYTKAALTFYQQGLDEEAVQARTESVLKAQNITGAGDEMADYLTAVWNGYKVANEEAELYVDKLASVADSSASNMSLLAIAMSKVASTANAMGVDVDQLNAQIATIVATTRQAPESVGNALKTIYSRINDISTGAEGAEVSLGNYSKQMAAVGFSVLDANGNLRDTGEVIEEIGGKWADLSREEQIYLARTMAGQRQYNNLIALFDNWSRYSDLVNVSMDSQGTLMEKNSRYMESLGAKMEQLGAAGERVKSAMINEEDLKGLVDFGTGAVNLFGNLIESIGGGRGALLAFGSIFTQVFSGTIAKELNNVITNFQNVKNNVLILKNDIASIEQLGQSQGYQDDTIKEMVDAKKEISNYYNLISALQLKSYNNIVKLIGASKDLVLILEEQVKIAEKYQAAIQKTANIKGLTTYTQYSAASLALEELIITLLKFNRVSSLEDNNFEGLSTLYDKIIAILNEVGKGVVPEINKFKKLFEEIGNIELTGTKLQELEVKNKLKEIHSLAQTIRNLTSTGLIYAGDESLLNRLDQAKAKLELATQKAKEFQTAIQQFGNIKGIVDMSSALGRLASGISSLTNLKNVWTNLNLSGGEKFLQTITNLGMSVPMLVSALKTLKTTTMALSAVSLAQNKIQLAQIVLDQKDIAVTETKNALEKISHLNKQTGINLIKAKNIATAAGVKLTGLETTVLAVKTTVTEAHTVALEQQKAAQLGLNAAMSANPIGAIIMGITAAIGAITAIVKVYDHFTMSAKEAELAIDAFNQKQKLIADGNANLASQIAELENIKDLYELLAEKAGAINFDSNIDNLTLAERQRYNLLKGIIAEYNEDAVAGYNAQGLVILQNNTRLEDQIDILKRKRQAEIDSYVSSQLFEDAEKGYRKQYQDQAGEIDRVNFDRENRDQIFKTNLAQIRDALSSANTDFFQTSIDKINLIEGEAVDNLGNNILLIISIIRDALSQVNNIPINTTVLEDALTQLENIATLDLQEQTIREKTDLAARIPTEIILARLSSSEYNEQYNQLALAYGEGLINSLIKNYIQGVNNGVGFTFDNSNSRQAAQKINEELLSFLSSSLFTELDIAKLQLSFSNFTKALPFDTTLKNYKAQLKNFIELIVNSNQDLKNLAKDSPDVFNNLIKTIFGLDNFLSETLDYYTGEFKVKVKEATDSVANTYDSAVEKLNNYFTKSEGLNYAKNSLDLSNFFNNDLLGTYAILHTDDVIAQLGETYGSLTERILQATKRAIYFNEAVKPNLLTMSLLGQLRTGDIDLKGYLTLVNQLNLLALTYPLISNAVGILETDWMRSTSAYQEALRGVNGLLLLSMQASLEFLGQDAISEQIKGAISDSETLQDALGKQLLITEDYADTLGRLASQYESCSDELNHYVQALIAGDELTVENAQAVLTLSLRSAELAEATGISGNQIERVAAQLALLNPLLLENSELAADAAVRYIRLNTSIEDLYTNADNYRLLLSIIATDGLDAIYTNEELFNSFLSLKDTVANVFDTSSDALSDDWITSHLEEIIQMAELGGEGLEQLRAEAAEEILVNTGIDMTGFNMNQEEFLTSIAALEEGADINCLANLDLLLFIQQLVTAMQQAGLAQLEILDRLSGLGVDIDLAPYEAGLNQLIDDSELAGELAGTALSNSMAETGGVDAKVKTESQEIPQSTDILGQDYVPDYVKGEYTTPIFSPVLIAGVSFPLPTGSRTVASYVPVFRAKPNKETVTGTTTTSAAALLVVGANKSSGGKISHYNSPASRAARTPSKPSRGGGGGSKGSTPKAATQAKVSTTKIENAVKTPNHNPYEQELKSYLRQSKILDELQDQLKKLVNKDRLKNLLAQNKTLKEQEKILNRELDISKNSAYENSTADYARRLGQQFKDALSFDADGQISDINKLEQRAADIYNEAVKKATDDFAKKQADYNLYINLVWNKYSTQDEQNLNKARKLQMDLFIKEAEKESKDAIKKAEEEYKTREDLINSYTKAWEADQKRLELIKEIQDQILENQIAASKIKVNLAIDTGDFERDWLDFENKFIKKLDKDDFLGNAKASAKELMSYFNSDQVQQTASEIEKIRNEIAIMQAGGPSSIYSVVDKDGNIVAQNLAQAQEDLEDYMKQQMDDLGDVQDLIDDIKDNYLDALDNAKDKMDDQIDQYERVNDLIDHNVKLTLMLYGDTAYNTMNKYYELQKANNKNLLESLRMQQQYWQDLMKNLTKNSPAWNLMKKNLDNVTDNLNSKLEEMIENLSNQWLNRVDGIIAKLNNALTGGRGLDYLDEQWDYINTFDDNFLDTFESNMGIQEVTDLYQLAIDGLSGSPANQQKINKLMNEQLKILREKDNLTQYDIDRAKAALEVEKARMALEDARYNKTKMRLRRDSQGNYTYQYVADEEKLGDLQAALADAQANLYNMDKEHYTLNLNTLYDAYKDYIDKMRELTEEYNNTQDAEERTRIQARIDLLRLSTNNLMQGLTEDNKYALQYLNESFFGGMGIDTTLLSADEQMEIMTQNIPQMQSNIQDLANTLVGEGGILNATNDAMKLISDATVEYDKNVKQFLTDAGSSLQIVTNVTDAAGNALDKNIVQAKELITTNDELIKSCEAQVAAIQTMLDWLDKYINKVMDVSILITNLRGAYGTGQELNGSNLTADEIPVTGMGLDTTTGMEFTGNPKTDAAAVKQEIDHLMAQYEQFLTQMSIAKFDTGGSTGSWGDAEGRLAFLHEKELVLNQQDTANILAAVEAVRIITGSLNGLATGEIGSLINNATGLLGGIDNTSTLDQNVHIEANFPNVTQHTEIEQAFNNLVNMASMRASGYRD